MDVESIVKHTKLIEINKFRENDMPLFKVVRLNEDGTKADLKLHKKASEPFHDFARTWNNVPVVKLEVVDEAKPKKKSKKKSKKARKAKKTVKLEEAS